MRDAEFQLLVAACGVSVRGGNLDLPPANIGWDRFLALTNRHRVQAICWDSLKTFADAIPPRVVNTLQTQSRAIVVANLRAAAESKSLLQAFQDAGVRLLFLKGLTLGALAYRHPLSKMSLDIDLLVESCRILDAARLLRTAGYAVVEPPAADDRVLRRWHAVRKESVWYRAAGNVQVDLHTRLTDQPAILADSSVQSPSQEVEVTSGITLPTLANDELFAYLCVHGASSAWFRLKWIADFSALLKGRSPEEIERLFMRSQELGAGRAAAQALLLSQRIFATGIGPNLRDRLASDRANRRLVRIAESQLYNPIEPTERFLGTATIHLSQLGLLPGWRFKLRETARQALNFLGKGAK